jgi:ketosteroid isomerase-like protein
MRPVFLRSIAGLAAIATLTACAGASSGSSTDVAAIGRSIDSLDVDVQRWFNTGAADSIVAGYYTSDAVVMDSNSPADRGSEAIRTDLGNTFKTVSLRLHLERASLVAADFLASDQGHYTLELRSKKDTSKVLTFDHGSYVTTFVKRNGQWRARYDIAASEVPLPAPAPAPAKKK